MHEGKSVLNIQIWVNGASTARLYIYLLNVPSFSSRYFNKIKRTSRLGSLLALSLEILRSINEPRHKISNNVVCATSKSSTSLRIHVV